MKYFQKTLARVIKTIRKKKGLSQKEVARRSELHPNTIYLLEFGKIEAKFSTVFFLAKGLDVKFDELVHLFVEECFKN